MYSPVSLGLWYFYVKARKANPGLSLPCRITQKEAGLLPHGTCASPVTFRRASVFNRTDAAAAGLQIIH